MKWNKIVGIITPHKNYGGYFLFKVYTSTKLHISHLHQDINYQDIFQFMQSSVQL